MQIREFLRRCPRLPRVALRMAFFLQNGSGSGLLSTLDESRLCVRLQILRLHRTTCADDSFNSRSHGGMQCPCDDHGVTCTCAILLTIQAEFRKKSRKGFPGHLCPRGQRVRRESNTESRKQVNFRLFSDFLGREVAGTRLIVQ